MRHPAVQLNYPTTISVAKMAKVAKPRQKSKGKSNSPRTLRTLIFADNPRSRAARRATSPSMNTDKSIKEVPRVSETSSVLAPHRGGGIQKKKKVKPLKRSQRVRHERGLARAEAVQDRTHTKIADATSRLKKRQSRRALWDEVNDASKEEARKAIRAPGRFDSLNEDDGTGDDIEPFHGDTEIKVIDGVQVPTFATGQTLTFAVGPSLTTTNREPDEVT